MKIFSAFRFIVAFAFCLFLLNHQNIEAQTVVRFETSAGDIELELFDATAPVSVANFLGYVERGDYEGTIFHRSVVAPSLSIVQGGGFLTDGAPITVQDPIVNEFGASNTRGTIAYARLGGIVDSATSQFFFNSADNGPNLDNQNAGFTTFGTVTAGLDIVDAIQALDTIDGDGNPFAPSAFDDLPVFDSTQGVAVTNLVVVNTVSVLSGVLGDVSRSGQANFFDITPFIMVLAAEEFQPEADCNEDGEVNFFDIAAFIAILSGT